MMTCRLLCALLVLALCCCPSVCATDAQPKVDVESSSQTTTTNKTQLPDTKEMSAPKNNVGVVQPPSPLDPSQGTAGHSDTSTTGFVAKPGNDGGEGPGSSSTGTNPNGVSNTLQADGNKGTKGSSSHKRLSEEQANSESEDSTEETTTTTTTRQPQLRPPPLRRRRQVLLRLQRRQPPRPPTHRRVFAKLTAASAALRGCVPRCCSPYPRWRTTLWTEGVCAGCACQHSTAGICARVLWPDVINKRK
ncbi:putative mucin TcMUCII [Trypanosoma cruzi]|uniref:Putative mucin TcMUCII n=1 Tax=Trypanosoma cruzi TaxID=5693 RepID=A0A2V2X355_TRYCR|nr:putative mucin TcMUCII [Trypanosoma cruzi]RNC33999.1 mucin TcMUCII [Trypanosoma cruzi]